MPDFGQPVADQIKTNPNQFLQTLGGLMNVAQQKQQIGLNQQKLALGNIGVSQQTEKNQEFNAINASRSQWLNPDGSINMQKAQEIIPEIAPQTGTAYLQNLATMSQAHTAAQQAKMNFNTNERQQLASTYAALGYAGVNNPKQIGLALDGLKAQYKDSPAMQQYVDAAQVGLSNLPSGPMLPRLLIEQSQSMLTPSEQQAALAPRAGTASTGGNIISTETLPSVAGSVPTVQKTGMVAPMTLPPTATTVSPTGQPQYVGTSQAGSPVAAGLSPLQQQNQQYVGHDWATTQSLANAAQQDIPVLNTIKEFAQGAITNTGASQRTLAAGLMSLVGISPADQAKTNTDILAKNSNMLALAGGDTNLAKQLAEVANPNYHMTKQAIQYTANEVIAMKDMALFKQKLMQQFDQDPNAYMKMLGEFNRNADFRAMMFPDMTPREHQQLKASMSPAEQKQFGEKLQWMQEHGAFQ